MTQPFQFPNGQLAHNAEDLLKLCQQFPYDGANYLVKEDLEKWLSYIGQDDIAQCAARARQTAMDDRQKLAEFLTKCHNLASPETQESVERISVTETTTPEPEVVAIPVVEKKIVDSSVDTPSPVKVSTPPETSTARQVENKVESNRSQKPSFFRVIARLIINIFYRN